MRDRQLSRSCRAFFQVLSLEQLVGMSRVPRVGLSPQRRRRHKKVFKERWTDGKEDGREGGREEGFLSLKTPMGIITSRGDEIRARYRRLPRHSQQGLPSRRLSTISRSAFADVVPKVRFLNIALVRTAKRERKKVHEGWAALVIITEPERVAQ